MAYTRIWVSYCSKCRTEFGHLSKGRAMAIWKKHLQHNLDLPELRYRQMNLHYESLLDKEQEQAW